MADRAVAGPSGNSSLRGLRERMVAAAQAVAKERRDQSGASSFTTQSPNTRSTIKPVIDGSVLKNDIKQKLAKERREERKRQQEANKEIQLLEKERKAKLQYEKQLEEKQRKIREQKEKDERRRISAEEKRKQKFEEERERYKAVLSRTLERSNRADQQQKRWSWEGPAMPNSENKPGKIENKRSSSLNRREGKVLSSADTEHVEDKPAHRFHSNPPETNLMNRLLVPTRASGARSKNTGSSSIPGKDTPGVTSHFLQYVHVPLRSHSSDELKSSIVFCNSSMKMPLQTKVEMAPLEKTETPLKVNVEASPKAGMEVPPKVKMEVPSEVSIDTPPMSPMVNMDISPMVSVESSPVTSAETSPLVSVEVSPVVSMDASSEVSMDTSPDGSMDLSPDVSMEVPYKAYTEASREGFLETPPEANVEATPKVNVEVPLEEIVEALLKESLESPPKMVVEAYPQASVEVPRKAFPKVSLKASPKVNLSDSLEKPEMDKQTSNTVTKKYPPSNIPCYRQSPSPASGGHPPSPINAIRPIQKNHLPSPSPVLSKQSAQVPQFCKTIPVQRDLLVSEALNAVKKKRESVSKATSKCEPMSQKHMIYEESGNKSAPGTISAEEATKILSERRRLAREQKDKKEERHQKEMESRKVPDVPEKADKGHVGELSKYGDGQQQEKEIKKNKGCCQHHDQKVDAKIKAQEEVERHKKEQERLMLQNLQERLERKKRIEEIMKRTRKPDANTTKVPERSSRNTSEDEEADDEGETESDEDSLDKVFSKGIGDGRDSSTKNKMPYKNAMRMPQKLVFLQATTGEIDKEKKAYFNGDLKSSRPKVLTQLKGSSRLPTKKTSTHTAKAGRAREITTTIQSTPNINTHQEWIYDRIDIGSYNTESPATNVTADSHKQNLKDSMTSQPGPQMPVDRKKKSKSAHLGKASAHLHAARRAVDLEPSPAFSGSRAFFGREEEDSDI